MNPSTAPRRARTPHTAALDALLAEAGRRRSARHEASAADFRARVEERLRSLEAELSEVKGRLNGLLFLAAGAVLAQIALQLFRR